MTKLALRVTGSEGLVEEDGAELSWPGCTRYLSKKKRYLLLLKLAMYLTGGQPPRTTELGVLKYCNSPLSLRNVYSKFGKALYLTEYHKKRSVVLNSYFIVRYLPEEVGQMLMRYIVFIRPFADSLYTELHPELNLHVRYGNDHYLFCSDETPEKPWDNGELCDVITAESKRVLGFEINISSWRQIVTAVTNIHVQKFGKERQTADQMYEALWAWQAGHKLGTRNENYGLDAAFPSRLQAQMLCLYLALSQCWHEWLGFSIDNEVWEKGMVVGTRKVVTEPGLSSYFELSELSDLSLEETPRTKGLRRKRDEIGAEIGEHMENIYTKRQRFGEADAELERYLESKAQLKAQLKP